MLVYGDRTRVDDPRAVIVRGRDRLARLDDAPAGVVRHAALVAAFVEAAELAQGIADAAFEAEGCDRRTPEQAAAMALVMALAGAVIRSWEGGFSTSSFSGVSREPKQQLAPAPRTRRDAGAEPWVLGTGVEDDGPGIAEALDALAAGDLPGRIAIKEGEGFAFYALYPEAYVEAARSLAPAPDTKVIGLRSVGTALAAMVAARLGAPRPITLRPVGHPFRRELKLAPELRDELLADPVARFAVVDEGPGLSGSSFGAVIDLLETGGVTRERITVFPGHGGDLGPQASAPHRARWAALDRRVATFDSLVKPRLACWVEDLTGPAVASLRDLSGGAWRALQAEEADWPPANTWAERRKFLLRSASGTWLLKFAGLGPDGEAKLARANTLAEAGFTPSVVGLRHGFLVERWTADARPLRPGAVDRAALIAHLARYLAFRARAFPAEPGEGAATAELYEMIRMNVAEALGDEAASRLRKWEPRVEGLARAARPIHVDGRLHAFEWLVADGRPIKTDALDHSNAHDLVGCQDLAWDVAGAEVEFDMESSERAAFRSELAQASDAVLEPERLAFYELAYLAFQLGVYVMAADVHDGQPREQARLSGWADGYRERLRALLSA